MQLRAHCARSRARYTVAGELSCACPSISCTRPVLYRVRRPGLWFATGNSLSQHHPCKPYRNIKSFVVTGMTQPSENSIATQGDPCCDPNTWSQPQTLSQHKISVATRGQKSLSRSKPPSFPRNPVAIWKTLSRHRARETLQQQKFLCRNREP